jgi:hypothetical protein
MSSSRLKIVLNIALPIAVSLVVGLGTGLVRRSWVTRNAKPDDPTRLEFLLPSLENGSRYGDQYIGEVSEERWQALTKPEKEEAATVFAARLIDTHHIPTAIVFSGRRVVIAVTQAEGRLVDE